MEDSRAPSSAMDGIKKGFVRVGASCEEGLAYTKATVVGFAKKLTAKSEKDATNADLQAAKMQVAAADHAEQVKNSLH